VVLLLSETQETTQQNTTLFVRRKLKKHGASAAFSHKAHCELRWFSVEEPKRNDREDINIRSTLRYRYTVFPKYQRRI